MSEYSPFTSALESAETESALNSTPVPETSEGYDPFAEFTGTPSNYQAPEDLREKTAVDEFGRSFGNSLRNVEANLGYAYAIFQDLAGQGYEADRTREAADETADYSRFSPNAVTDIENVDSLKDLAMFGTYASGELLGSLIPFGVGGASGNLLARGLTYGSLKKQLRKNLKKEGASKDDINELTYQYRSGGMQDDTLAAKIADIRRINEEYTKATGRRIKDMGTIGALFGTSGAITGIQTGSIDREIVEATGESDAKRSLEFGILTGAATLPVAAYWGSAVSNMLFRRAGMSGTSNQQIGVDRALKQMFKGGAAEAPVEALQEAMQIYAVKEAQGLENQKFSPDEIKRVRDAAVIALVGGAALGGTIDAGAQVMQAPYDVGAAVRARRDLGEEQAFADAMEQMLDGWSTQPADVDFVVNPDGTTSRSGESSPNLRLTATDAEGNPVDVTGDPDDPNAPDATFGDDEGDPEAAAIFMEAAGYDENTLNKIFKDADPSAEDDDVNQESDANIVPFEIPERNGRKVADAPAPTPEQLENANTATLLKLLAGGWSDWKKNESFYLDTLIPKIIESDGNYSNLSNTEKAAAQELKRRLKGKQWGELDKVIMGYLRSQETYANVTNAQVRAKAARTTNTSPRTNAAPVKPKQPEANKTLKVNLTDGNTKLTQQVVELSGQVRTLYQRLQSETPVFAREQVLNTRQTLQNLRSILGGSNNAYQQYRDRVSNFARNYKASIDRLRQSNPKAITPAIESSYEEATNWLNQEESTRVLRERGVAPEMVDTLNQQPGFVNQGSYDPFEQSADTANMPDADEAADLTGEDIDPDTMQVDRFGDAIDIPVQEQRNREMPEDERVRLIGRDWDPQKEERQPINEKRRLIGRPFISNAEDRGANQAQAWLSALTDPNHKGYNAPEKVLARLALNPDRYVFDIRPVDMDGNILPEDSVLIRGHVIEATPVASASIGNSLKGSGVNYSTMNIVAASLKQGQQYVNEKSPNAKLTLTIPVTDKVSVHAYLPTLAAAGRKMMRESGLISGETEISKSLGGVLQSLGEGLAGLDYYLTALGHETNVMQAFNNSIAENKNRPIVRMNGENYSLKDILNTMKSGDFQKKMLQYTDDRINTDEDMRKKNEQDAHVPNVRIDQLPKDTASVESQARSIIMPLIRTAFRNNPPEIIKKKIQPTAYLTANAIIDQMVAAAFDPTVSIASLQPSGGLFKNPEWFDLDRIGQMRNQPRDRAQLGIPNRFTLKYPTMGKLIKSLLKNKAVTATDVDVFQTYFRVHKRVTEHLATEVPNVIRKHLRENGALAASANTDSTVASTIGLVTGTRKKLGLVLTSSMYANQNAQTDFDLVTAYVALTKSDDSQGLMTLPDIIQEAMKSLRPEIIKDLKAKPAKGKFGGLVTEIAVSENELNRSRALGEDYDYRGNRGERGDIVDEIGHKYEFNKGYAEMEAMASAIRQFANTVAKEVLDMQPLPFSKMTSRDAQNTRLMGVNEADPNDPGMSRRRSVNVLDETAGGRPEEGGIDRVQELYYDENLEKIQQRDKILKGSSGSLRTAVDEAMNKEANSPDPSPVDDVTILQNEMNRNANARDRETMDKVPQIPEALERIYRERVTDMDIGPFPTPGNAFQFPASNRFSQANAEGTVFMRMHENIADQRGINAIFDLANWAAKTFSLVNSNTPNPILIVDNTGLAELIEANTGEIRAWLKGAQATPLMEAMQTHIHSSNPSMPVIIRINTNYEYVKLKVPKDGSATYTLEGRVNENDMATPVFTFAHELGHLVSERWKREMPKALIDRMVKEYNGKVPEHKRGEYPMSEWIADQFALYVNNTVMGKDKYGSSYVAPAWKKLFSRLKSLYAKAKKLVEGLSRRAGVSESYHQFLSKVHNSYAAKEKTKADWIATAMKQAAERRAAVRQGDAVNAAKREEAKRKWNATIVDPTTRSKDTEVRQRTVPPQVAAEANVEALAQAAEREGLGADTAEVIRQSGGPGNRARGPRGRARSRTERRRPQANRSGDGNRRPPPPPEPPNDADNQGNPRRQPPPNYSTTRGERLFDNWGEYGVRDPQRRNSNVQRFAAKIFGGDPTEGPIANYLSKVDRFFEAVNYRLSQIPGGAYIANSLREQPGSKSTGRGTYHALQRRYYGQWYSDKFAPVISKRKGESQSDYQERMRQIRDEIATGQVSSPDAVAVQRELRAFANWLIGKQEEVRRKSIARDRAAGFEPTVPDIDSTVLRILEGYTLPHNWNVFALTSREGRLRFYDLMDQYEQAAYFQEFPQAPPESWEAFKDHMYGKLTNSEGVIAAHVGDNTTFAHAKSRILRHIPTHELMGNGNTPALINDQMDQSIRHYLHDATRNLAWETYFGGYELDPVTEYPRWNSNRYIKDWLNEVTRMDQEQGTNLRPQAESMMETLQGRKHRKINKKVKVGLDIATAWTNMVVLPFTVFASLPDLAGPMMRSDRQAGNIRKNMWTAVRSLQRNDPEGLRKLAENLGVVVEHNIQHAFLEEGNNTFDTFWNSKHQRVMRWQENFFKYTGLEAYTNMTRMFGMLQAYDFADEMAYRITAARASGFDPYTQTETPVGKIYEEARLAKKYLDELGVTPEQWVEVRNKESIADPIMQERLTDIEAMVINKFVDESIMRPGAELRPEWMSDPRLAPFAHLKSYMWYMGETYWPTAWSRIEEALGPDATDAAKYAAARFGAMAMMMVPLAALGLMMRDGVYYAGSDSEPPERDFLDVFFRTGLMGALTMPIESIAMIGERGMGMDNIAYQMGPIFSLSYGALTKSPDRTLANTTFPTAWNRGLKDVVIWDSNESKPDSRQVGGRTGQ
ncbi:MAG: hypothetical protein VW443_05235 [Pseudomonadales bacterium]